jgi:hypothetical protein
MEHPDPDPTEPAVATARGTENLRARSERLLRGLSGVLVSGARQVATESDRWFLVGLRTLHQGVQSAQSATCDAGRHLVEKSSRLRPAFVRPKSARERVRAMLLNEARRARLSTAEFEAFSEQIAIIIELVLQGAVKVSDIAFEHDERARSAGEDSAA